MMNLRGPKVPLTAYLNMHDLELVKSYAGALGVSDSAWVAALIQKALHGREPPGQSLPARASAFLIAVAEEWLEQQPEAVRDDVRKRVDQRSRELSSAERQGMLP